MGVLWGASWRMSRLVFSLVPLSQELWGVLKYLFVCVVGEALVVGSFWALVPGRCARRLVGRLWMWRVSAPQTWSALFPRGRTTMIR